MLTKRGRLYAIAKLFQKLWTPGGGFHVQAFLVKAAPLVADEDVTWADVTEADFVGYSRVDIEGFSFPTINGVGEGHLLSPTCTYTAGAIVGPQTIYGMGIVEEVTSGVLESFWFESFSPDLTLSLPGDQIKRKLDFLSNNYVP